MAAETFPGGGASSENGTWNIRVQLIYMAMNFKHFFQL